MSAIEQVYLECERARTGGDLIAKVSASDKEFHFQNWVQARLDACGLDYDETGRNTYPDFRLVNHSEGYEVKGLAWPGRDANYDSNSQVPTGRHRGREVYYIFGRYPKDVSQVHEYPVTDLVVCHGSFLNANTTYVHQNKNFRGFGSYGDIMVRDRKMYVVPTPFALTDGTAGLSTLIVPEKLDVRDRKLVKVGDLARAEVDEIVASYEFNLETNEIVSHMAPNPTAGLVHYFSAYRSQASGAPKKVAMRSTAGAWASVEQDLTT